MAMRIGINGFGRMGPRAGWNMPELEIVRINENATRTPRATMAPRICSNLI